MDTGVTTALDTMVSEFTNGGLQTLEQVVILATPMWVTIAVLLFGVKIFRKIAHI